MPRCRWFSVLFALFFAAFALIVFTVTLTAQSPTTATTLTIPTTDQPYIGKPPVPPRALLPAGIPSTVPAAVVPAQANQPQAPAAMADRWWAAFQSYRSGNWEIYRLRGNGNDFAQLTFHPAADTQPRLNLGVTAIVFVSTRDGNPEIYRMNADGSNGLRLTTHPLTDTHPSWSPDSTQITFVSQRDGNPEIYRMNAGGAALQRLTADPALDLFPNWSPDGQQLVWVRAVGDHGWLWLMNQDGSHARAISGPLRYLQHPIWSPDGSTIAFDYDPDSDGFNELGLMTVADGTMRLVQDGSQFASRDFAQELWMGAWSPNGEGITYSALDFRWDEGPSGYTWVLANFQVAGLCVTDDCPSTFFGIPYHSDDFDLLPSVQSEDPFPPRSAINPLPTFKRRTPTLFVSWEGSERGSYITGYDIQVRVGKERAWQPWLQNTYLSGDNFLIGPGDSAGPTRYFRSRAYDDGGNVEPWPTDPDGDTSVTFYATTLSGRVTDQRGVGRANVPLALLPAGLTPVQTNATGDYFVRLSTSGIYQVNGLRVNADSDLVQPFYLAPEENLIQNGDFEALAPLEHWQLRGTITPTLTLAQVSHGLQGAQLGQDCMPDCVVLDPTFPLTNIIQTLPLWTPDGQAHLFVSTYDPRGGKLYHLARSASTQWAKPELLPAVGGYTLQPAGDRAGNLFLTWMDGSPNDFALFTMEYASATGWGPAARFGAGEYPQAAMGGDGSVHLLYIQRCGANCFDAPLIYRWRSVQGTWSSTITIAAEVGEDYKVLVGQDGTANLLWSVSNPRYQSTNGAPRLHYYQRYRDGLPLHAPMRIEHQGVARVPYLDPQDRLVIVGASGYGALYTETPLTQADAALILPGFANFLAWSADGTLYSFAPGNTNADPWLYRFKPAGGPWSTPQVTGLRGYLPKAIALDASGQLQAVTTDGRFLQFPPKVGAGQSYLAQTVAIPANLHQPTLAWLIETQGSGLGDSSFQVRLDDGIRETILYSTTAALPLQLQWADLNPWLGQMVTITFAVEQAADQLPLRVFLDHITLGSWETPVPQAINPAQFAAGIETTITISGENFIATPQVTLAGKALLDVRWVDATTLVATVPATVPPGIHELAVTNPGGIVTVLPSAVKVGKQLYLPIMQR